MCYVNNSCTYIAYVFGILRELYIICEINDKQCHVI